MIFIAGLTLTAGLDYISVDAELQFNSSVAMQCLEIQVINDTVLELDELFLVTLEVADPDVLLGNNTATITIENNDRERYSSILCILLA